MRSSPCSASAAMARRTVWRLTAKRSASSSSVASLAPGLRRPVWTSAPRLSAIWRHRAMPWPRAMVSFISPRLAAASVITASIPSTVWSMRVDLSRCLDEYTYMPDVATPQAERARWIACLGQADPARLEAAWAALSPMPVHRWLRKPETGLVMLRGRAGGNGEAFNLGEMTMTRAAVLLEGHRPITGFGYVAGRNHRHAELAALFRSEEHTSELQSQ